VEELITILSLENEVLKRENSELRSEIVELRSIIQRLEDSIALLKGGNNSRTSSTAPSRDIGRSNSASLRTPSGKKSGGQVGHCGHTLQMVDNPDEIIDHFPVICECCGDSLDMVPSVSFTRHQVIDIPPPVAPLHIEHRSHSIVCPCCKFNNRGIFPDGVQAPIQ